MPWDAQETEDPFYFKSRTWKYASDGNCEETVYLALTPDYYIFEDHSNILDYSFI